MNIFRKKDLTNRVGLIDEVRGALIILVVIYHAVYLYFSMVSTMAMPDWLMALQPLVYVGAGLFILISGISCNFSHNNFTRGLICFGIAYAITLITTYLWNGGNDAIAWGILHLIGFSIILFDLFRKLLAKTKAVWMIPILAVIFIVTFRLKDGFIGIPYLLEYYFGFVHSELLFPLGLTAPNFYSADYYPLLPWLALFLIGTYLGRYLISDKAPSFVKNTRVKPLAFLGRHTLLIYIAHIPVLIGIYELIKLIIY